MPTGHLVFAREGTLWAAAFDLASLTVIGPEIPVLEGVSHGVNTGHTDRETGAAQFAFSESGSLAYIAGSVFPESQNQLVWVNRDGEVEPVNSDRGAISRPFLSPDRSTIAFKKGLDIWTYDLTRNTSSRQTFRSVQAFVIWSPDGKGITFDSARTGVRNLFHNDIDSGAEPRQLFPSEYQQFPGAWSPDGKELAFVQVSPDTQLDVWILSLDKSRPPAPLLDSPFKEEHPAFSPSGRWLAYVSDEADRTDVYVQPYPEGPKRVISPKGGQSPA